MSAAAAAAGVDGGGGGGGGAAALGIDAAPAAEAAPPAAAAPAAAPRPSRAELVAQLHAAAEEGDCAAIVALLDQGAPVDGRCATLQTALHHACEAAPEVADEAIELLLARGAAIDARDDLDRTPLMLYVARDGVEEALEALLAGNPDLAARDLEGKTVVRTMCMRSRAPPALLHTCAFACMHACARRACRRSPQL